jgi:hypothetical protein
MRSQRGQTAAEYLGALLVVSVVIAAVAQSAPGHAIGGQMRRLVCVIGGGGNCGAVAASPPGRPRFGPYTRAPSGPPLAGGIRNFPVLTFPGSVTMTCTGSFDPKSEDCGKGKGKVDGGVRVKATVTRGRPKLNPSGCPVTTLGLTTALEAYGSAKVDGKKAGAGVELYGGRSTSYDITVSSARANAIADGKDQAPNPLDPTTLHTGEGIELSDKYYAGLNLTGQYEALQATMGFEKGRKLSTGVKRIDGSTVRIYVGDSDYVKQALTLGVNTDLAKLYLGNDTTISDGKLRAIDLDIDTPAGWAAYQAFAKTGTLPKTGTNGTTNPTTSSTVEVTSSSKLGVAIGGLDASVNLGDSEGHLTETHNPDGSTTRFVDSRYRDVGLQVIKTTDANGRATGTPTYALNLRGVDQNVIDAYEAVNGLPKTAFQGGNVRIQYSAADLDQIRNQAADHIRYMFYEDRAPVPSRADVLRQMAGNPYAAVKNKDGLEIAPPPLEARLAAARTPEDVLVGLYDTGLGNSSAALADLTQFAEMTNVAHHGGKPVRGPLGSNDALPGTPVVPNCG